jgi:hypothetical protein
MDLVTFIMGKYLLIFGDEYKFRLGGLLIISL